MPLALVGPLLGAPTLTVQWAFVSLSCREYYSLEKSELHGTSGTHVLRDSVSDQSIDKPIDTSCSQGGICEDKDDLYQAGCGLLLSREYAVASLSLVPYVSGCLSRVPCKMRTCC